MIDTPIYNKPIGGEDGKNLPRVITMSGGSSSALMMFSMLESGQLEARRGDCVIFNNTSAEHPATYRFVADCKRESEQYGIPFFMIEFCTYEGRKNKRGEYVRKRSYKLVNERPYNADTNPHGYRWRGERFEEMLSFVRFCPNRSNRVCTWELKSGVSKRFVKDYLRDKRPEGICSQGTGAPNMIDLDLMYRRFVKNRGKVPEEIYKEKSKYILGCDKVRPEQAWSDYSKHVPRVRKCSDDTHALAIGFRHDEPRRVLRWEDRICNEPDRFKGMLPFFPLYDLRVTKEYVADYWAKQKFRLSIPQYLGNCVYCFLKGVKNLEAVRDLKREIFKGTPSDIQWWIDMENKYIRDLVVEGVKVSKYKQFGFFNHDSYSYKLLRDGVRPSDKVLQQVTSCDCTD